MSWLKRLLYRRPRSRQVPADMSLEACARRLRMLDGHGRDDPIPFVYVGIVKYRDQTMAAMGDMMTLARAWLEEHPEGGRT